MKSSTSQLMSVAQTIYSTFLTFQNLLIS